ncbi:ribonuclease inhibitor-like [Aquarana catesbeiana]|uniref:ribonuclease inhibitor-like n=1 Tax=Aquarana catesbeiana TaxID=8400 RepID=UPI003CC9DA72
MRLLTLLKQPTYSYDVLRNCANVPSIMTVAGRFDYCTILSKDCRGEDKAEEEDSSSSGYKRKCDSLSFLMNPESIIQKLRLDWCAVTSSGCDDLRSILINNRSLTRLDLSGNNLEDSGIKLLCEGLRHPGCTLQSLSIRDCKGTLWCCDDLCSVIPTNRTLTSLYIILDDDEKMSESEVRRRCEVLQNAGFSVYRWDGGGWIVSIYRRR